MQPLVYGWNVYAVLFWIVYIVWFVLEMIGALAQRVKAGAEKQDRGSMVLLGIILRQYAIRVLGRYFTREVATRADQPVVQNGPYKFIRHPAYSGTLLTVLGIGLAMTNWASLVAILVCSFTGYFYRVLVEERALRRSLGPPYVEYMRRTKRFVPFVF
jgi:protein-S-isoprenylcysteine O-methyltransferase Ste14